MINLKIKIMAITPDSGKQISINEAKTLIADFKTKFPDQIKASFLGINVLNLVLQQQNENVIGIRIYYGYDTVADIISPVLVGVNDKGEDITAVLVDRFKPCPDYCDINSPLY